jgi:predicted nucleic acid-binding protein
VRVTAVVDATCLIGLERVGRLDLLPALLEPVLVASKVVAEFGRKELWMTVEEPQDAALVNALELLMDAGEAASIALAVQRKCRVILDDLKVRKVAAHMGLSVTGTVGLLVKARQEGVITSLREMLDDLDANGFHIGMPLRMEALRLVGE